MPIEKLSVIGLTSFSDTVFVSIRLELILLDTWNGCGKEKF